MTTLWAGITSQGVKMFASYIRAINSRFSWFPGRISLNFFNFFFLGLLAYLTTWHNLYVIEAAFRAAPFVKTISFMEFIWNWHYYTNIITNDSCSLWFRPNFQNNIWIKSKSHNMELMICSGNSIKNRSFIKIVH